MKRTARIVFTALMVLLLGAINPLQVFAAAKPIYISEIRMANAEDFDDAKNELTEAGFTVIEDDINPKTKENFVLLGYKTTSDPAEAITDLKALKQDNGYTIFDSEDVMGELKSEALEDAIYLKKLIDGFRTAYESGQSMAKSVYPIFQNYRYSDSELLGDFLLNPELTANDLTDITLYASPEMTSGLYRFLRAALIPDSGENCFTRLAAVSEDDYEDDNRVKSAARVLLTVVKSYQSYVLSQAESCNPEGEEAFNTDVLVSAEILGGYSFGGVDLFTFIMNRDITLEQLYPLAAAMTECEVEALRLLGVAPFAIISSWKPSDITDSGIKITEAKSEEETLDFWAGSAKTDYGRIAITNDLLQQMIVGSAASAEEIFLNGENIAGIVLTGLTTVSTIVTGIIYCKFASIMSAGKAADSILSACSWTGAIWGDGAGWAASCFKIMQGSAQTGEAIANAGLAASYATLSKNAVNLLRSGTLASVESVSASAASVATKTMNLASNAFKASVVLLAVAVVITLIFFVIDLVNYYNPDYSEFPAMVLSEEELPDGTTAYVTYRAVMDGDRVGDTNCREGRMWNAIYTTVSDNMGVPLRAGTLKVSRSSEVPNNTEPLSLFGAENPFDLNTNVFTHDTGVYLFYGRVNENTLASVFAEYNILFIAGGAAALVVVATAAAMAARKKKAKA